MTSKTVPILSLEIASFNQGRFCSRATPRCTGCAGNQLRSLETDWGFARSDLLRSSGSCGFWSTRGKMQSHLCAFKKGIQNVKPDVKPEPQRSHRSVSYLPQHCSSESKQRHKGLGWKVSFLKQGSDSPTFLTAQTREASPPPGSQDPPRFPLWSKSQAKAAVVVCQSKTQHRADIFWKGTLFCTPLCLCAFLKK